jgi:ribosome-binding factor A
MNEDILRELSAILREMKDPRVSQAMLSIVKLDVSQDLSSAKVYVSSMMGIEKAGEAADALKKAAGYLRTELGRRLAMRHTPQLRFFADDSIERSANIIRLMHRIQEDEHEN